MADTTCSDKFLGHNPALSDHDDNASSDDSSDEDLMLGTQGIDYIPMEHVHENRSNRKRGNVHRRLCSKPTLGSRQQQNGTPPVVPIFRTSTCRGSRFIPPRACAHRGPPIPSASSTNSMWKTSQPRIKISKTLFIMTCLNRML